MYPHSIIYIDLLLYLFLFYLVGESIKIYVE